MLQQPVGLRFDEASFPPMGGKWLQGSSPGVASAVDRLSRSRLPVTELQINVHELPWVSESEEHPEGLETVLMDAVSSLIWVRQPLR